MFPTTYSPSPSPSPIPTDLNSNGVWPQDNVDHPANLPAARMNLYGKLQQQQQHSYAPYGQGNVHHAPYGYVPGPPPAAPAGMYNNHPSMNVGPSHMSMHHLSGQAPALPSHLSNLPGVSPRGGGSVLNHNAHPAPNPAAPVSAHWQQQIDLAKVSRLANSPHQVSRAASLAGRGTAPPQPTLSVAKTVIHGAQGHRRENSEAAATPLSTSSSPSAPSPVPHRPTAVPHAPPGARTPTATWSELDMNGMNLKGVSPTLLRYTFLTAVHLAHNHLTALPAGLIHLPHLAVLDVSSNRLTAFPPELGLLHHLRELYAFDNQITTIPDEFGFLYQLTKLGLEGNPLQEDFRRVIDQKGTTGLIESLRDNHPLPQNPPPPRIWTSVGNELSGLEQEHNQQTMLEERAEEEEQHLMSIVDAGAKNAANQSKAASQTPKPAPTKPLFDTFTVMCYNILFEKYATAQMYGYTPSWALKWDYRKARILEELQTHKADVICLQEVSNDQFQNFILENMKGYNGVFKAKSRARTMTGEERSNVDGCGILIKEDVFSLVETHLIEFNQVGNTRPDFKKTEDLYNRVLTKDNIAVVATLEHKLSGARLILVDVHLHWDPAFSDVKLVQTGVLMDELEKISSQFARFPPKRDLGEGYDKAPHYSKGNKIPTIICGDFNSTPDSGVFEFLSQGSLAPDHPDFLSHRYGKFTDEGLKHHIPLKSAYSYLKEPMAFTDFTPGFTGVIDYLWFSTNSLVVSHLLEGIDPAYTAQSVGFPNAHFPSDHVPLLGEFKFKPAGK